jgi:hypothetical protein
MMDFFSTSCDSAFRISEKTRDIYHIKQNNLNLHDLCIWHASVYQGHLLPLSSTEAPSDKPHNQAVETGSIISKAQHSSIWNNYSNMQHNALALLGNIYKNICLEAKE